MRLLFTLFFLVSNLIFSQTNIQTDFRSALTGETTNFGTSFFYNQPSNVILGSAYLFDGTTGQLLFTITSPNPGTVDGFGTSVAVAPNGNLIIGAYSDNTDSTSSGRAYVYDGTDGSLLLTLENPTPEIYDYFGYGLDVTPNGNIIVGADGDNTDGVDTGRVYLFDGTTGSLINEISNPHPEEFDYFGFTLKSTSEGDILVGSLSENRTVDRVYLFDGSNP